MLNLYKFSADWCSGCKTMEPIIKEVIKDYPIVNLIEVDAENDENGLLDKYMVRSLPTLIFESDDKKYTRKIVGTVPAPQIVDAIEKYLNSIV